MSNEPYHPPRPYKAVPHSRRETHDSYNDETFGSNDCTSEDRAEEERKRRASFELWRKEQQKSFQEKKINPERRKDDFDISELLVDSKDDKGLPNRSKESDEPIPASNIDSSKSSFPSLTPAPRPLVPPGFTSTILERNFGIKTSQYHSSQDGSSEIEGSLLLNETSDELLGKQSKQYAKETLSEQQLENTSIHLLVDNKSGKALKFSSALDKSIEAVSVDSEICMSTSRLEAFEAQVNSKVTKLDSKKLLVDKILTETSQDGKTSILDKLFGSALTPNGVGSTILTEPNDSKADETWAPDTSDSSKFAHLFLDEEKKPVDDLSTSMPKDLLSLIQGGEKGGFRVSDKVANKHVASNFPFQISELEDRHVVSNLTSPGIENFEKLCNINDVNKPAALPAVLTCEDLEKSILSRSTESDPTLHPAVEGWKIPDAGNEKQEVHIVDHASQHLLSLLQRKTSMKNTISSANLDIRSSERVQNIETGSVDTAPHDPIEANAENASSSGKSLTLEALFGSAFMKELQSVGAPPSVQKGSIESARVDVLESNSLPLLVTDDSLLPSTVHIGSERTTFETNTLPFTQREQIKSNGFEEHLLGYNDAQSAVDSSHFQAESASKLGRFDGSTEIQLPEEDSLIGVGNPVKLQNFMTGNLKTELLPSEETPIDVSQKLASLKAVFRDERPAVGGQEGPPFLPGPFDMREPDIPFCNQNVRPSSPQLHPRLNHVGPLIHSLDYHPSNINSQVKFMAPDGIIHHDALPNHQFPASMLRPPFHHPSSGQTGFDPPMHHPMLQQMPMPGNFPPPHLQQGFPRGTLVPPHSNNQVSGFIQELIPMHGFPFGSGHLQPQPNFAGLEMPPGHEVGSGSHHPEALQRLIEMELRSNSKQISSFGVAGHGQGMYGHGLDTGLGYR
ncbi:hypothetical protein DITRI_Ditri13aG0042200 [Diplodiscus trichospermus]